MSIVSVEELFPGRRGGRSSDTRETYERVFEVIISSDLVDGETEVLAAVDPNNSSKFIPQIGQGHPKNANALCVDVTPEVSDETPQIWYVNCSYDTRPNEAANQGIDTTGGSETGDTIGNIPENPLARAAVWRVSGIDREEPVKEWVKLKPSGEIDFYTPPGWQADHTYGVNQFVQNGGNVYYSIEAGESDSSGGPTGQDPSDPIIDNEVVWLYYATVAQVTTDLSFAIFTACLNSGKCPFDPPPMTDVSIPTIVVTKNIPFITMEYNMLIKNAVNSIPWKGVPAYCAKVLKFDAGNKKENNVGFVEATWEVGLNPDTWLTVAMDQGFGNIQNRTVPNPLYTVGGAEPPTIEKRVFMRFRDAHNEPYETAMPMNGAGGLLDPEAEPIFFRGIPRQMKLINFAEFIPW